jgi:flagellar motor switch protein FliM
MAEDADTKDGETPSAEEAAMLAEWEAMASEGEEGGGDAGGEGGSVEEARVLDQAEIDALLGFDGEGDGGEGGGVLALVNSSMVSYERLPMLDIVFDRLVRLMSTSLRNLTTDNVDVSLDEVSTVRFGDYLNSIPLPAMISVFKAEEWDNSGLVLTDSALIYSIVDVLLGGRRGASAIRIEGRPYTTIETRLVEKMVSVILSDLSSAFDPLSPVSFGLERIETNPRFATITQSGNACVLVRMRVDMGDRGGRIEILIPYATLEPIRELLLQMFMGEKFGRDSIWESHLTEELYKTDVQIQAVLGETTVRLHDVLNWRVGTRVMFATTTEDELEMRCGDFPVFRGPVGQKQGKIALRIEDYIPPARKGEEA